MPEIEGLAGVSYLTNSTILELTELPEHLAIVGGSYIALEFAQMFRRFGSRVTVLVRGERVLAREDKDFAEQIQKVMTREGVEFLFNTVSVEAGTGRQGDADRAEGHRSSIDASHLLFATGRTPNTDDLGLEQAGIALNKHGLIDVDGQLRTQTAGVWALGDVNGRGAFTHTSYNDYEIIASNVVDGEARSVDSRIMCYAVFVDPPFARVGMSETEVRKDGRRRADRHHADVARRPRARTRRDGWLHEGAGGRRNEEDSRRGHAGY